MTSKLALLAAIVCLAACTATSPTEVRPASAANEATVAPVQSAAASQADAGAQLRALFKASDEANLKRNPLSALFRGDMRYADQLGEFLTDAYYEAEREAARSDLRQLAEINRASLSPTDRIAYDVFKRDQELTLRSLSPEILSLTAVRPIDHFFGFHTFYPDLASGQGAAPFKTVADYENNLKRPRPVCSARGPRDRALPPKAWRAGRPAEAGRCATSSTS
jgi:uncharacterized protein (DUF885 family)